MKKEPLPPTLAFACPQRWSEMRADGPQRRFCDQCQLHVRDLSAMTARQGRNIMAQADGRLCVSFQVRPDGTMVTRSRRDGLRRGYLAVRQMVLSLLAMATPFAFVSCNGNDRNQQTTTLGKVCVAPAEDQSAGNVLTGMLPVTRTAGRASPVERVLGTPSPPEQKH